MSWKTVTDQMGRRVELARPPHQIISLVPSQTELLYDLGADEKVVGITKFCVHPRSWFKSKERVGGTKTYHFDRIASLQPDLIIANKEENDQAQIEALAAEYPVWISDVKTLDDAIDMIRSVGDMIGENKKAEQLASSIKSDFDKLPSIDKKPTAAYLIWHQPLMVTGGDTFINEMLDRAGYTNIFADQNRYPQTTAEALQSMQPEVIMLSSEPFPFKEKHIQQFQSICPDAKVLLVDGELFSWYGSRLTHAAKAFANQQFSIL